MKIHPVVGAEILERVQFPLSGGADRAGASRKVGWHGISARPEGRTRFRSARAFWRRWIFWTRWPPTASTGARCRWTKRCSGWRQSRANRSIRKVVEVLRAALSPNWRSWCAIAFEGMIRQQALDRRARWNAVAAPAAGFEEITAKPHNGQEAQLPVLDRRGPPGSADAVRTEPGPGHFAEPGRDAVGVLGAAEAAGPLRRHRHLRARGRRTDSGVRERRQLPAVLFAADSAGTRSLRLGGGEPEADHQRQSIGRTGLSERSHEVQHPAFGAGGSARRAGRAWSAC